jgi:hypothetical protein
MSAFMVSNQLMQKVVTAILQNTDAALRGKTRARFYQIQAGAVTYEVSHVRLCAAQRYGPPVTIDLTPDGA